MTNTQERATITDQQKGVVEDVCVFDAMIGERVITTVRFCYNKAEEFAALLALRVRGVQECFEDVEIRIREGQL